MVNKKTQTKEDQNTNEQRQLIKNLGIHLNSSYKQAFHDKMDKDYQRHLDDPYDPFHMVQNQKQKSLLKKIMLESNIDIGRP